MSDWGTKAGFAGKCAAKILSRVFLLSLAGLVLLSVFARPSAARQSEKVFAAVLFNDNTENVAGAERFVGVFARDESATTWQCISNTNVFTFGVGFSRHGATKRYYLAGGNGLHRSADGGKTWKVLTNWETMEVLSVAVDPYDSTVIYIATPYGVYKSIDDGQHWTGKTRGVKKWYVDEIILDWRDHRTLYAAAEDDLYRSTDGGESWSTLRVGVPDMRTVLQHPKNGSIIWVGTEDHGVRVSFDSGKRWQGGKNTPAGTIYALSATADGSAVYAAGYQTGVWHSSDDGLTWQQIWPAPEIEAIYSLCVDPDKADHILAGTNGKGIYESRDQGKFWKPAGLEGMHIRQILFCPF
jgi:photosystem II stability/assembly factor-like uncharacterized protein